MMMIKVTIQGKNPPVYLVEPALVALGNIAKRVITLRDVEMRVNEDGDTELVVVDSLPGGSSAGDVQGPTPPVEYQFKPGQSGNPAGRAKGSRNRQTIVREALEAILAGSDQQVVDAITAAAIAKAMTGDIQAYNALMDSGYGKLTEKSQVEMAATVSEVKRTIIDVKPDEQL